MSFTSRTRAATSCRACSFVPNGVAFASPSSCRVFFAVSACLLEIDDCCCRFCFDVLRLKCKGTVRLALLPVMRSVPADNQCKQTLVHVHVMAIVSEGCVSQVPCLEYALVNRVEHGVWGGASERQRRRILKARRQSRLQNTAVEIS